MCVSVFVHVHVHMHVYVCTDTRFDSPCPGRQSVCQHKTYIHTHIHAYTADVCTDTRLDNPCPGRQSVCQHSTQQAEFKCACDPAEGYLDEPLDGGFCMKMHYLRDVTVIDTDFSVCLCHV